MPKGGFFTGNNTVFTVTNQLGTTAPQTAGNIKAPTSNYKNTGGIYQQITTFQFVYLGAFAADPTLDGSGNPLKVGQLYFNTTNNALKVYTGSTWQGAVGVYSYNGRIGAVLPATGDYSFSQISGVAAPAQLPPAALSAIGGVQAVNAVSHQWLNSISTAGVPSLSQPAFSDISGVAAAAQLPTPTTTTLGGVKAVTAVAHQWIVSIDTTGTPQLSQPAFSDISGSVALSQMANLAANSVIGNNTGVAATPIALTQAQLTAMINPFTSVLLGAVPASGGGAGNFLRADTSWTNSVAPASGNAVWVLDPQQASQQGSILFNQTGVPKWQIGKQTDNTFFIYDSVGATNVLGFATGGTIVGSGLATTAQYQNNTASKLLSTDKVWGAAGFTAITWAATMTPDLSTGINFSVTMTGNATLANPTNTKAGQCGVIVLTQDATGSRTLAYGTSWKFPGGTAPVLTTAANAVDTLFYTVIDSTHIQATLGANFK